VIVAKTMYYGWPRILFCIKPEIFSACDQSYTFAQPAVRTARWS